MSIGEAAKLKGVSITTLRRWEASGKLAAEHTAGGHRCYDLAKIKPELFRAAAKSSRRTVAYARVSSHDQKDDLERQKQVLELYCARQGWTMREALRFVGKVMSATISGVADRWFVSITVDTKDNSHLPKAENQGVVGVDLGVSARACK